MPSSTSPHGPVHYDNANLTVRDSGDIADIAKDGPRILFTKRTEFAGEQEYRFAVSDSRRPNERYHIFQRVARTVATNKVLAIWRHVVANLTNYKADFKSEPHLGTRQL